MILPPRQSSAPPRVLLSRDAPRHALSTAIAAGSLERLRRGAYGEVPRDEPADGGRTRRALGRIHAVHAQTTAHHWFSHTSAALLWGCWVHLGDETTHLTQRHAPCGERDRTVKRHTTDLPTRDRTELDGLPLTTLERTVVDVACGSRGHHALMVADSALRLGADRGHIDRLIVNRAGRRGIARARLVLAAADALAESPGESILRWFLLDPALPVFTPQVGVRTRGGHFRVDLGVPRLRVAIEFDGAIKYTGEYGLPSRVEADEVRRQGLLEDEGWIVERFGWADLDDRDAVVARVQRALFRATSR